MVSYIVSIWVTIPINYSDGGLSPINSEIHKNIDSSSQTCFLYLLFDTVWYEWQGVYRCVSLSGETV